MLIYPSIDLLEGSVVRLARGDYAQRTTYSDRPTDVARGFAEAGARWIHVVDLDAALTGLRRNAETVRAIAAAASVCLQLGGGARDTAAVEGMLADGADRVVVGSAALEDWAWFASLLERDDLRGRLALGLDARDGRLAVQGWTRELQATPLELAVRVSGTALAAIVYTDIARDGMLEGVNLEATARLIAAADVPVIASGGIRCLDDVRRCKEIGCSGVIIGRAYYEGMIDLKEALHVAEDCPPSSPVPGLLNPRG